MSMNQRTQPSLDDCKAIFAQHGGTDLPYLEHHWPRFAKTKQEVEKTRPLPEQAAILDIGAHWLHQALPYALDGHQVTALDLPVTMTEPNVVRAAQATNIRLLANEDLEHPAALATLDDDSFDVILFTEIIEHITFNPVAMWREVYRVLKPGGRIVVTTPNYYALRGRLWRPGRLLHRFGGGLEVAQILNLHTYAHHWKEYSLRELIYYFCLLSPDFNCIKAAHLMAYSDNYLEVRGGTATRWIESALPILRPSLHLEVELPHKTQGIAVEPHW